MQVFSAGLEDQPAWLALAAEVEPLFGPMVGDPGFRRALDACLRAGRAACLRIGDGEVGTPLLGGVLFSGEGARWEIDWLAVAQSGRRGGAGRALVHHVLAQVQPPAQVRLVTFAPDDPLGEAARRFYAALGFRAAEIIPNPYGEGLRQVYLRDVDR